MEGWGRGRVGVACISLALCASLRRTPHAFLYGQEGVQAMGRTLHTQQLRLVSVWVFICLCRESCDRRSKKEEAKSECVCVCMYVVVCVRCISLALSVCALVHPLHLTGVFVGAGGGASDGANRSTRCHITSLC